MRDLERQLDDALAVIAKLESRVAELEDRLRANRSNSSAAPSSDPLWAPRFPPRKPTGKSPGGQKGHPGHCRSLLPPEQLDAIVEHRPRICRRCGRPFPPGAPAELRARHQVAELPPRAVRVTEHRAYACRCVACGARTAEPIPPEVRTSCTGPRLAAVLCYLSGRVRGSRRAVAEVAAEVLGLPLSLGSVANREAEMAAALERPCGRVQRHVRSAPAKNVDETGWRRAGRWLWVAATHAAACFRIDRNRNWHGLQNLLGRDVFGTTCSDRHGLYNHLKPGRRAVCWAHLQRDFTRWRERGGPTARLGEEGLRIAAEAFRLWHRFRVGKVTRRRLQQRLLPLRRRLRALLGWGATRDHGGGTRGTGVKASHFCRNLLALEPALWTFARVAGVEPTNNHAERRAASGGDVAQDQLRQPQRRRLPVRRADADGDPDVASAAPPRRRLPRRRPRRSPTGHQCPLAHLRGTERLLWRRGAVRRLGLGCGGRPPVQGHWRGVGVSRIFPAPRCGPQ